MRIRIFRAATLAEAMASIRDELGADALILSDRNRGGYVEVTAALEGNDSPPLRPPKLPGGPDDLEPFSLASKAETTGRRRTDVAAAAPALLWHGLSPRLVTALSRGSLEAACARVFRFADLRVGRGDDPLLLAGPPGGGKTLTVARLATRLVLGGEQPMVITTDGRRAGATEQLAAFTRLLGLTMVIADSAEVLRQALAQREAGQPVLIDAPGLDLANTQQAKELRALREAANAALALVLPCGLDPGEAEEIACAHVGLGARSLIATRTDLSRRLGGILCAASASGLILAEAGVGDGAADGLVAMTPRFIASRLQRGSPTAPAATQATSTQATSTQQPASDRLAHSALSRHIAAQRRVASSL